MFPGNDKSVAPPRRGGSRASSIVLKDVPVFACKVEFGVTVFHCVGSSVLCGVTWF